MSNVNDQGVEGQVTGAPVAAPTPAAPVVPTPAQPAAVGFWDRAVAWLRTPEGKLTAGVVGGALVLGVVALANRDDDEDELPSRQLRPALPLSFLPSLTALDREDQLAVNREEGALYEQEVGAVLEEVYSDKVVLSQVSVTTLRGKMRRADYVIGHKNGAMTAVEVKKVSKVTEKIVRQAEEQREGLRHTFGVRSGPPLLVVPEDAEVPPELAARVRVRRHG